MPELPEVETIRRQLEKLIVGKTISSIEVFNPGSFIGDKKWLIGNTISGVGRKGKVIIVSLKRPGLAKQGRALYVHLKMSGQLQFKEGLKRSNLAEARLDLNRYKHLRVKIKFSDKSELWFIDQRKFGWITDNSAVLPLGIDALDPELTAGKLTKILKSSHRPVKTILLDQSKIAGIGNIYASEILWQAKINPATKGLTFCAQSGQSVKFRPAEPGPASQDKLHHAIKRVLTQAIELGGSTMDDGLYQHVGGESGNYWSRRRVYDREGEPCLRCKKPIEKGVIGQRSTYWCSSCQIT